MGGARIPHLPGAKIIGFLSGRFAVVSISPFSAETLRPLTRLALSTAASSPVTSPNPQVGCVIVDDAATVLAQGRHLGAGSAHAEAAALAAARESGIDVTGQTAIVTLEPCSRHGRTPPCADALIAAGVARVYFLVADPSGFGGGGKKLRGAGLEVFGPEELAAELAPELILAQRLLLPWTTAVTRSRPYVVAKFATTIDGRIAAADGSSRWITGPEARQHVHEVRAKVDGILIGTGTVLTDDPTLTVRLTGQTEAEGYQPRRIVLGRREVPPAAQLRGPGGELITLQTHDIPSALTQLFDLGLRHIVVEGGALVLAEFFRAGLVDEVHHYLAPALLGAGAHVLTDFGVTNISQASRWRRQEPLDLQPDRKSTRLNS